MRTLHEFGTTRWIDVIDPTIDELDELAAEFGLGYRTFDEAHRRAARPMMRHYPDHVYVVAFSGSFAEIDMYLGPSWFITVRRHGPEDGEWDAQPVLDRADRLRPESVSSGLLLTMLLEELVEPVWVAVGDDEGHERVMRGGCRERSRSRLAQHG